MSKFTGDYPPCWPLIAAGVAAELDDTCERCGHKHDPANGYAFKSLRQAGNRI